MIASSVVANALRVARGLPDTWHPRVIAEIGDVYVKVARLAGSLAWHAHDDEDEMFVVLEGKLDIELESAPTAHLAAGDFFVVPRGTRHNPVARDGCCIMLIERKTTLHTGSELTASTRSIRDQLG